MTRAPGWRSATERETPSGSYAPSPVNEATGPVTWSSKGPTCEPSSTSLVVSSDATIRPVSASTPMWSLRQDRRTLVPCFSISHSPEPQSFRPVLSTSRCTGLTVVARSCAWRLQRLCSTAQRRVVRDGQRQAEQVDAGLSRRQPETGALRDMSSLAWLDFEEAERQR